MLVSPLCTPAGLLRRSEREGREVFENIENKKTKLSLVINLFSVCSAMYQTVHCSVVRGIFYYSFILIYIILPAIPKIRGLIHGANHGGTMPVLPRDMLIEYISQ